MHTFEAVLKASADLAAAAHSLSLTAMQLQTLRFQLLVASTPG